MNPPCVSNSGCGYHFFSSLAQLSPTFAKAVDGKPELNRLEVKGEDISPEMVNAARGVDGGFGCMDFSYAAELRLPVVQVRNQSGIVLPARCESLQLAMRRWFDALGKVGGAKAKRLSIDGFPQNLGVKVAGP